jgi:phosphoribosylaminoimidazole (AIR) synthetase
MTKKESTDATNYDKNVIEVDTKLAKKMGELKDITNEFADDEIHVFKNIHGDHAMAVSGHYDLLLVPLTGAHEKLNAYDTSKNFVLSGAKFAKQFSLSTGIESKLVAMSNIMDWGEKGDDESLSIPAKQGLIDGCKETGTWINAGESAVLSDRVTVDYNISGTATILIPKKSLPEGKYDLDFEGKKQKYIIAKHNDKLVYQRCDGNGTKPELNMERLLRPRECVIDTAAMTEDDIGKMPLFKLLANLFTVEVGQVNHPNIEVEHLANQYREGMMIVENENKNFVPYIMNWTNATGRISGFPPITINANSTAVALVEHEVFLDPPVSQNNDNILLINNIINQNVRCNGLSGIRPGLIEYFNGDVNYHETKEGRELTMITGNGATKYHELAQELYQAGASHFGHFSGGAWDAKAGKIWAKEGLGAKLNVYAKPHLAHQLIKKENNLTAKDCANKFNYCGEAWVSVSDDKTSEVLDIINKYDYDVHVGGILKNMNKPKLEIYFSAIKEKVVFQYD